MCPSRTVLDQLWKFLSLECKAETFTVVLEQQQQLNCHGHTHKQPCFPPQWLDAACLHEVSECMW
jgi:hypothetical protein